MLLQKEKQGKIRYPTQTITYIEYTEQTRERLSYLKLLIYRADTNNKAVTSMKTKKESPLGGEKLLRLLASGSGVSSAPQKSSDSQALNNMPLNFAQGKHIKNTGTIEESVFRKFLRFSFCHDV